MPARRSRIGFVDYQLENFHANVYLKHVREELRDRGYSVAGCWAMDDSGGAGREWAKKNAVPWFDDAAELDRQVDCYAVLAPSNPETHLALCRRVFPFAKPTYVDKTFAPDLTTAEAIFALADRHGVPMQTSSALRYTNVQAAVHEAGRDKLRHMVAWGPGRSFEEYAIHPVEMIVSCMGPEAERLMRRGTGAFSQLLLDFSGDRTAVANVYAGNQMPFAGSITTTEKTRHLEVDTTRLFVDMAAAMLDLFDAGKPSIDRRESLVIRRVLDVAQDPAATRGFIEL